MEFSPDRTIAGALAPLPAQHEFINGAAEIGAATKRFFGFISVNLWQGIL
jgi:hypothetical protein